MSFHDCTFDLREAERGEAIRRKHELDALGKAVSRELAALNAKVDRLSEMLGVPVQGSNVATAAPEKPMTISDFARRVGLSRPAIYRRIKSGEVTLKGGRIPPSELTRLGL